MFPGMIPLADIGSALTGLGTLFVTYLGPALALALVIAGFNYMAALDDHQRATNAKRAIGVAIAGAILVAVGLTMGPTIAATISK
jgi:uncharacterized membrane protein YdcZ (DUF606 family)